MLTGNIPNHNLSEERVIFYTGNGNFPKYNLPDEISSVTADFVAKMLATKSDLRPNSQQALETCTQLSQNQLHCVFRKLSIHHERLKEKDDDQRKQL